MKTNVVETPKPAAFEAVTELASEAKTPEDQAQLASWRAEIAEERKQAVESIGKDTLKLAQLPDGTIVPKAEVEKVVSDGNAAVGSPYDNGRRS